MERSPTVPDSKYYTFLLQLLWNIEWFEMYSGNEVMINERKAGKLCGLFAGGT